MKNFTTFVKENWKDEAMELRLYIDNDSDLYRQRLVPIVKNIQRNANRIPRGNTSRN